MPSTTKTLFLGEEPLRGTLDFDSISLKLASPETIRSWSYGEVTQPETINYRSQKPERGGLFCEKIFGPVKDWECACGKYNKIRYRGIICDRCGVEVTRSSVRRERMGHIELATPVSHIWYLRITPSRIGLVLNLSVQALEKVIYFANFIITNVNEKIKSETLKKLKEEFGEKKKDLKKNCKGSKEEYSQKLNELVNTYKSVRKEIEEIRTLRLLSENEYRDLSLKYGHFFEADIGAEAIYKLLSQINLTELASSLKKERLKAKPDQKKKIVQRLKLIENFIANRIRPEWMMIKVLPVIPPELRPIVQLDGGKFASSDLNDLYRRVINRNNRLKKLLELNAPEVILRNEKRMLQEAVDALIDNTARNTQTVTASTGGKRPLKSLADNLKGKQGRFRQNLLGKRVDYSGRSVIVVGPKLCLEECGLPKIMALELFRPFVASKLIERGTVHNVRSANRLIEEGKPEVWDILEEVIKDKYVFLNRAPTLHRISIQAFKPVLIEGKAIQIHPLVCPAFNADFDGDQMAVYLPLTEKAQKEAREIILSSKNLLKPANGKPIVTPTKDMVWGAYYLTLLKEQDNPKSFSSPEEAILAYELGKITLQEKIKVKINKKIVTASVGRIIFNSILPEKLYQLDKVVDKNILSDIITKCLEIYKEERTVELLDQIKETTLTYLTASGLSWGMDDLPTLSQKKEIIKAAEKEVEEIQSQYEEGLLAENEKYQKNIEIWMRAKDKIAELCRKVLDPYGSVYSMLDSGARGSWTQLIQMLGMKGIVSSPTGRLIELPIKNSYKEGFNVLEYFISTHGVRKGVSDTALRTSSAGYLSRRLIDVAHDVIITGEDCGDTEGELITKEESEEMGKTLAERIFGRVAAEDILEPKTQKVILKQGEYINKEIAEKISKLNLEAVRIRSVLSCKFSRGICAKCYGYDLGNNKPIKVGQAVGIVAAQSIGEPGTQLTLRTFHTGGVAGRDITQGLPRVEELFEVKPPKRKAIISHQDGVVKIFEESGQKFISIKSDQDKIEKYEVPPGYIILVKNQEKVKKGDRLTDGDLDLQEFYSLKGKKAVQKYILKEIQYIYSSQGQDLNDKHIEIIIRQMFSRRLIEDTGDTELLLGEIVPVSYLEEVNTKAKKAGQKPAQAHELLLGISRVSLSTESWLSAASFQETSRVLVNASITSKPDFLFGLKENVIIGRLLPIGEGQRDQSKK